MYELLLDYKIEFFLQLFNDTSGLTVEKESGETFQFNKELSAEISDIYADYTAIDRIYERYAPEISNDPNLRHITLTEVTKLQTDKLFPPKVVVSICVFFLKNTNQLF